MDHESPLEGHDVVDHDAVGRDVVGRCAGDGGVVGHGVVVVVDNDKMEGVFYQRVDDAGRDENGYLFQGMCDYGESDSHVLVDEGMETQAFHDEVFSHAASSTEVSHLRGQCDPQIWSKL